MLSRLALPLFAIVVLASGWIGLDVNRLAGVPDSMEFPAALIWILAPLLVGAAALFDRSRRHAYIASWRIGRPSTYVLALTAFPAASAVALAAGWACGALDPHGSGLRRPWRPPS